MSELKKLFVEQEVNEVLGSVRINDPAEWRGICPPPCGTRHTLTDSVTAHAPGPVFVFQARAQNIENPTLGIIVHARSMLTPGNEQRPLAARLSPALRFMAFTAILAPDLRETLSEVVYNSPSRASRATIPLINDGGRLSVDMDTLTPDDLDRSVRYLL